ncbi:MAG: hypothetical protein LPH21_00590 [Shewanella sp.]|nr:hypothetical protein [Shewanella sp.]
MEHILKALHATAHRMLATGKFEHVGEEYIDLKRGASARLHIARLSSGLYFTYTTSMAVESSGVCYTVEYLGFTTSNSIASASNNITKALRGEEYDPDFHYTKGEANDVEITESVKQALYHHVCNSIALGEVSHHGEVEIQDDQGEWQYTTIYNTNSGEGIWFHGSPTNATILVEGYSTVETLEEFVEDVLEQLGKEAPSDAYFPVIRE